MSEQINIRLKRRRTPLGGAYPFLLQTPFMPPQRDVFPFLPQPEPYLDNAIESLSSDMTLNDVLATQPNG